LEIGSLEEEVDEIPPARPEGQIDRGRGLEIEVVAVTKQEKIAPLLERNLKGGRETPPLTLPNRSLS
jgi:hypothetical protein